MNREMQTHLLMLMFILPTLCHSFLYNRVHKNVYRLSILRTADEIRLELQRYKTRSTLLEEALASLQYQMNDLRVENAAIKNGNYNNTVQTMDVHIKTQSKRFEESGEQMQQQLRRERIYRSELEGIKRMLSSEKYLVESKLNQTVDLLASNKLELSRSQRRLQLLQTAFESTRLELERTRRENNELLDTMKELRIAGSKRDDENIGARFEELSKVLQDREATLEEQRIQISVLRQQLSNEKLESGNMRRQLFTLQRQLPPEQQRESEQQTADNDDVMSALLVGGSGAQISPAPEERLITPGPSIPFVVENDGARRAPSTVDLLVDDLSDQRRLLQRQGQLLKEIKELLVEDRREDKLPKPAQQVSDRENDVAPGSQDGDQNNRTREEAGEGIGARIGSAGGGEYDDEVARTIGAAGAGLQSALGVAAAVVLDVALTPVGSIGRAGRAVGRVLQGVGRGVRGIFDRMDERGESYRIFLEDENEDRQGGDGAGVSEYPEEADTRLLKAARSEPVVDTQATSEVTIDDSLQTK